MMKLHNVQLLRAIAALIVVCIHLNPLFYRLSIPVPAGGVDLFFVISGFIMVEIARDMRPAAFLARRAARVIPLYWTMTLFTVACVVVAPSLFGNTRIDAAALFKSLLFIPYATEGADGVQPILFVGWTLNYEMVFYLLFAAGLLARRFGLAIVFAVLAALPIIGAIAQPSGIVAKFYTSPMLLEFGFGMLVARVLQRADVTRGWAVALGAGAFPFVLFGDTLFPHASRVVSMGIPAALLVAAAVTLDRVKISIPRLSRLGDASYAIYLIHPFITSTVVAASTRLPANALVAIALLVLAFASTILAGCAVYVWFERPITDALNRRSQKLQVAHTGTA